MMQISVQGYLTFSHASNHEGPTFALSRAWPEKMVKSSVPRESTFLGALNSCGVGNH
jgi:hypothetical protein